MEYHSTIASFDTRTGSCRVFEVHEQVIAAKPRPRARFVSLETKGVLQTICHADVVDFAEYRHIVRGVTP